MKHITILLLSLFIISCGNRKKELYSVFNENFYIESVKDTIIISYNKINQNTKTMFCKLYKENGEFYSNDFDGKKILLTTQRDNEFLKYNNCHGQSRLTTAFKQINDSIYQTLLSEKDRQDSLDLVIWYTRRYEIKGIMWIGYNVVYNQCY